MAQFSERYLYNEKNYAVYAIIAFWALSVVPHFIGLFLLAKAKNWNYDNLRPWTAEKLKVLEDSVPKETWEKYQKLEGVSKNGFENLSLFVAAVLSAILAGLKSREDVNNYILIVLGLRVIYGLVYVFATGQKSSYIRTVAWLGSVGILLSLIYEAGGILLTQRVVIA